MFGTASGVERWLLVEQTGPFSGESVPAGRISAQSLTHLSRLAARIRGRLLLIRRPPGIDAEDGLRAFYADSRPGHERLTSLLLSGEDDLRQLSFDDPAWTRVEENVYLICTHGKHDPCCAVKGRPVAAAIAEALAAGRVWECSHIGGDRFAGNVVVLPTGLYLGRVEAEEASTVVDVVESGRVPVHYLRGRSSLSPPVQAAQHYARTVGGYGAYDGINDLLPVDAQLSLEDGPAAWTIQLACPTGDVVLTVRRTVSETPAQLTCHVSEPKLYPQFELVRI